MGKLPAITGAEAVRWFERLGYAVVRQRGSHVRLRHPTEQKRRPLTVPVHAGAILKPGLLRALLRQAGVSVEELSGF